MSEQSSFLPTTATLMPLPEASDALPPGTRVGEFEIREVIGVGGFGIVYRAWEPALEREVALKEYMPMGMVGRDAAGRLTLRSRACEEDYALGLRSFVNEARLLARFDHPSLVKVHRFWEASGTAYMAMPFYKAQTLRQRRQRLGARPPTQAWLMSMIEPLLGALAEMHRVDVYHRDIAPDNILWCEDQRPVLLDFGAARQVLADRTQHLTAVLKPQFAPIEQYADAQSMRQGPWTDLFALASTCYFMLAGRPPLPATARILGDDLTPLAQLALPGFSAHVLETLDWAMAVRPDDRPQSVAAFREALQGRLKVPERIVSRDATASPPAVAANAFEKTIQEAPPASVEPLPRGSTATAVTRPAMAHAALPKRAAYVEALRTAAGVARRHRWQLMALAVVAGGAIAWFWHGQDARESTEAAAREAALAGPVPALAASPVVATATRDVPGAAASAPAVPAAASSSAPGRAPGPRETCAASKSSNVEECVRRLCRSEPRFKRFDTCQRLQRQAQPWWKIFRPG